MGAVLLSDSVGATRRGTGLQIARQPEPAFQNAIHMMEKPVFQEKQRLYLQGTAESRRQVFEKWQEALTRQQQVGDLFSKVEVAVMPTSANFWTISNQNGAVASYKTTKYESCAE
jgi:hypothetical protein